jgi:hypothetical protein
MPQSRTETLERGNIYFLFRPKIGEDRPESLDDVQRMFIVLSPDGNEYYRLLVIGRKQLPAPDQSGQERNWGFVDMVSKDPDSIENRLDPQTYKTKTRGERHLPTVRPIGEGVYRIVRHDDHTHFVYALELPKRIGAAQAAFNMEQQASYIISIKNPMTGSPPATGLSEEQAHWPRWLQEKFRDPLLRGRPA